jgi:hypothetical protein
MKEKAMTYPKRRQKYNNGLNSPAPACEHSFQKGWKGYLFRDFS